MKKINLSTITNSINYDKLKAIASRDTSNGEITVSILCLCFNHAPYIERCLENLLNQKVNFNVEILIHDDASTDGSTEILKRYELKYPNIIKVFYEKENQYSQGINIENTILSKHIKGKYVAICECDDFWSNDLKLVLQVNCFALFPSISFVVHKVLNQSVDGKIIGYIPKTIGYSCVFERNDIVPRIIKSYIFHTTSYMFKSSDYLNYCNNLPKFAKHLKVGDYGLQLFFSNLGDTVFLDLTMSTHVDNVPGSWTEKSRNATILETKKERANIVESLELFDSFSNFEFHKAFLDRYNKSKMHELYEDGKYDEILKNKALRYSLFKYDCKSFITIYIMVKHPKIYKRIKKWKRKSTP